MYKCYESKLINEISVFTEIIHKCVCACIFMSGCGKLMFRKPYYSSHFSPLQSVWKAEGRGGRSRLKKGVPLYETFTWILFLFFYFSISLHWFLKRKKQTLENVYIYMYNLCLWQSIFINMMGLTSDLISADRSDLSK